MSFNFKAAVTICRECTNLSSQPMCEVAVLISLDIISHQIFSLFLRLNRERGLTILIVTHDMSLSAKVDRTVQISDGKISREREEEEYVVMDRAHRLQLGEELLREAGITSNRVRVEVVDGAIRIQE